MPDTPTTPEAVADFLDKQGTPGESANNSAVLTRKRTRIAIGYQAGDQVWQLGRILHFERHGLDGTVTYDEACALAGTQRGSAA